MYILGKAWMDWFQVYQLYLARIYKVEVCWPLIVFQKDLRLCGQWQTYSKKLFAMDKNTAWKKCKVLYSQVPVW